MLAVDNGGLTSCASVSFPVSVNFPNAISTSNILPVSLLPLMTGSSASLRNSPQTLYVPMPTLGIPQNHANFAAAAAAIITTNVSTNSSLISCNNINNTTLTSTSSFAKAHSSNNKVAGEQCVEELAKKIVNSDGEEILEVECGANKALMYVGKLCQGSKGPCILFEGNWLTPNEFQFVSGRETAKDWKRSIRHHGKSLKLLLSKNCIKVHATMCDCEGCRIGAVLTRKGEKRRIPNGERKRKSGGGCSAVEKLSLASLQLPIGYGDGKKLSEPSDPKRVSLPTEGHCQEHQSPLRESSLLSVKADDDDYMYETEKAAFDGTSCFTAPSTLMTDNTNGIAGAAVCPGKSSSDVHVHHGNNSLQQFVTCHKKPFSCNSNGDSSIDTPPHCFSDTVDKSIASNLALHETAKAGINGVHSCVKANSLSFDAMPGTRKYNEICQVGHPRKVNEEISDISDSSNCSLQSQSSFKHDEKALHKTCSNVKENTVLLPVSIEVDTSVTAAKSVHDSNTAAGSGLLSVVSRSENNALSDVPSLSFVTSGVDGPLTYSTSTVEHCPVYGVAELSSMAEISNSFDSSSLVSLTQGTGDVNTAAVSSACKVSLPKEENITIRHPSPQRSLPEVMTSIDFVKAGRSVKSDHLDGTIDCRRSSISYSHDNKSRHVDSSVRHNGVDHSSSDRVRKERTDKERRQNAVKHTAPPVSEDSDPCRSLSARNHVAMGFSEGLPSSFAESDTFSEYVRSLGAANSGIGHQIAAGMASMFQMQPPSDMTGAIPVHSMLNPMQVAAVGQHHQDTHLHKHPALFSNDASNLHNAFNYGYQVPVVGGSLPQTMQPYSAGSVADFSHQIPCWNSTMLPFFMPDVMAAAGAKQNQERDSHGSEKYFPYHGMTGAVIGQSNVNPLMPYMTAYQRLASDAVFNSDSPTSVTSLYDKSLMLEMMMIRKKYADQLLASPSGAQKLCDAAANVGSLGDYYKVLCQCPCLEGHPSDIRSWGVAHVIKLLCSVEGCGRYADAFRDRRVDGKVLTVLSVDSLTHTLGMKFVHAVVLSNMVARLLLDSALVSGCESCRRISATLQMHASQQGY